MADETTDSLLAALPPKRRRFVLAYIGEAARNATEAARIAGYGAPQSQGSRLLKFAEVAKCVAAFEARARAASVRSKQDFEELLTRIAFGEEVDRVIGPDGKAHSVPPKMRDRLQAVLLIGRIYGWFEDKVTATHHGLDGVLGEMAGVLARKRARAKGGEGE
jgi:hypothetical protein